MTGVGWGVAEGPSPPAHDGAGAGSDARDVTTTPMLAAVTSTIAPSCGSESTWCSTTSPARAATAGPRLESTPNTRDGIDFSAVNSSE